MTAVLGYRNEDLKPLRQKDDSQYIPEDQQIEEYARYIGVNLPEEDYMWELAREGVKASLPEGWQACQTPDGQLVYRNSKTKVVQEEHPMDEVYRQRVIQLRQAYHKYQEEGSQNSELNTIPEEKSEEKSVHDDSQLDDLMMPSKQFFHPSSTLKQQNQQLNQAMMAYNSSQQNSSRENSKFLANLQSIEKPKQKQKIGQQKQKKNHQQFYHQKQRLKAELQSLLAQERLAQQLLAELEKDNQRRSNKLKQKLAAKKPKLANKDTKSNNKQSLI